MLFLDVFFYKYRNYIDVKNLLVFKSRGLVCMIYFFFKDICIYLNDLGICNYI